MPLDILAPITSSQEAFIAPFLPSHDKDDGRRIKQQPAVRGTARPFVTLTYAASLDSRISLASGIRTTLSGPESKSMTHFLRKNHDAILVGVNTAIADDPSLNCRYPGIDLSSQPRPIIIDPSQRWDPSPSKAVKLHNAGEGKQPMIISVPGTAKQNYSCLCLSISPTDGTKTNISWPSILQALSRENVGSVMIEGGATIINDLLAEPGLVDSVIITIAPTFLGNGGVEVAPAPRSDADGKPVNVLNLDGIVWHQFGNDIVLCGRPKTKMQGS